MIYIPKYFFNLFENLFIKNKSNMWISTTKYYCEYFAVYSLLMKLGIKSEIHDKHNLDRRNLKYKKRNH